MNMKKKNLAAGAGEVAGTTRLQHTAQGGFTAGRCRLASHRDYSCRRLPTVG